jgi:hypothetical protein
MGSKLGTAEATAVVHPRAFTTAMMDAAQEPRRRSAPRTGHRIPRRADGSTVEGVEVDGPSSRRTPSLSRWGHGRAHRPAIEEAAERCWGWSLSRVKNDALGHVWTTPALQEESDVRLAVGCKSCVRPHMMVPLLMAFCRRRSEVSSRAAGLPC